MGLVNASGLLVSLLVWVSACGTDGGLSLPEYLGEACSDIGAALCDRTIECGSLTAAERLSCENVFAHSCCGDDGICNMYLDDSISSSEWNSCIDGFATTSCPDIDNGNLPSACIGI